MSQKERFGTRDPDYSAWHRVDSLGRFIGEEEAEKLSMIDLDAAFYVEYDNNSKKLVALIEAARDVDQPYKSATILKELARLSGIAAYVVLYRLSRTKLNESCPEEDRIREIIGFRVRCVYPQQWCRDYTPQEYAEFLQSLRDKFLQSLRDKGQRKGT